MPEGSLRKKSVRDLHVSYQETISAGIVLTDIADTSKILQPKPFKGAGIALISQLFGLGLESIAILVPGHGKAETCSCFSNDG